MEEMGLEILDRERIFFSDDKIISEGKEDIIEYRIDNLRNLEVPIKKRLLIIEDNVDVDLIIIRKNLEKVLESPFVKMTHCGSWEEFSDLKDKQFEVAIVDLKLNEKNGGWLLGNDVEKNYEGIRIIQQLNVICPGCRIIVFSNHMEDEIPLRNSLSLNVKIDRILQKGSGWKTLPTVVNDLFFQNDFLEKQELIKQNEKILDKVSNLQDMLDRTQGADRLLGQLLHEIKTPLMAMSGYYELTMFEINSFLEYLSDFLILGEKNNLNAADFLDKIKEYNVCVLKKKLNEYEANVHRSIEEITKRVSISMNCFKDKNNNIFLPKEAIDNIAGFLKCCYKKDIVNRIDFEVVSDDECFLVMDGEHFHWLMRNLIENAMHSVFDKYPKGEGGKIKINVIRNEVGEIMIKISDNGNGIPKENINEILKGGFTTKKEGSGCGMRMVTDVVKTYDGRITICGENTWGGATFEIVFPQRQKKKVA